jgi:pyrroloquinoline quinone biosynthesis protein B
MLKYLYCILLLCFPFGANAKSTESPYVLVLGVAQDGGYPHLGCTSICCTMAWQYDSMKRYVVSLALVDPQSRKWWLFEATPDMKEQLHYFQQLTGGRYNFLPDGIFITHAHIGHYTGLMHLGKEVMSTHDVPVYALPKLKTYLETNGPWSQLVTLHNIMLVALKAEAAEDLGNGISVTAFTVPHRDEYSETAGFKIITKEKKYLFIPDINKWNIWNKDIVQETKAVDIALVDATFYDSTDLPGRNLANVPHPLVTETMELFNKENKNTKANIHLIHFNHTNRLLWNKKSREEVRKAGFNIAQQGEKL